MWSGDPEPAAAPAGGDAAGEGPELHTALRVREKWSRAKEKGIAGSIVTSCLGRMAWLCAPLCTQVLKLRIFNVRNR